LQGIEFARKGKWKEMIYFGEVRNLQGTENARKDTVEYPRTGNCKEWNLEENVIYYRNGICKELNL